MPAANPYADDLGDLVPLETVGWIMAQMAGHDIHHLKQVERVERP